LAAQASLQTANRIESKILDAFELLAATPGLVLSALIRVNPRQVFPLLVRTMARALFTIPALRAFSSSAKLLL